MADIHKTGFDLIALYGRNTGHSDNGGECEIYELNNETGAGRITVYNVFSGIILIFNQSVDKKSAQKPYMRAFA